MNRANADETRALGDGLLLRWSRAADTDAIAMLTSEVFRDEEQDPPSAMMAAYARVLLRDDQPLMTPRDFAVVEDRRSGRIVACSCLLAQTWRFGDVRVPVGRPELVATHPDFRRRGLIRAIFDLLHARSAERGDLVQAITGIPYFYRQFGYEYALELGGGRAAYFADIPAAPPDQPEPYRLRPAVERDIPFLEDTYAHARRRSLVSADIPGEYWRYKIALPPTSDADWQIEIIVDSAGVPRGCLMLNPYRSERAVDVRQVETAGVGMREVVAPVLRALRDHAPTLQVGKPVEPPDRIRFHLGGEHPWYDAAGDHLLPRRWPPYAWYVRVANLPRFLMLTRRVLEQRLAASPLAGHNGDLRLRFYRGGLRLVFVGGALTQVEDWQPPDWARADYASFPPLVFLQLVFGFRDLDDLRAAYADVRCHEDVEPLVRALFPRVHSHVLPLD